MVLISKSDQEYKVSLILLREYYQKWMSNYLELSIFLNLLLKLMEIMSISLFKLVMFSFKIWLDS